MHPFFHRHAFRGMGRHGFEGFGRCGPGPFGGRRFDREQMLPWLEEYQRDLEQELADVADLVRRLKEETKQTANV